MFIVGIGGTTRPGSSSETALRLALEAAARPDIETACFGASELSLPLYDPTDAHRHRNASRLIEAIDRADGYIIASPGYHGTISGLVKNALDYTEDLRNSERPYLSGRPVGCIAVAYGWQAAVNTLRALRDVSHALRGWPTPYGCAINAVDQTFENGSCTDGDAMSGLRLVGEQVAGMAALLRPV